jgi:hypothetical protein
VTVTGPRSILYNPPAAALLPRLPHAVRSPHRPPSRGDGRGVINRTPVPTLDTTQLRPRAHLWPRSSPGCRDWSDGSTDEEAREKVLERSSPFAPTGRVGDPSGRDRDHPVRRFGQARFTTGPTLRPVGSMAMPR